jgi:hypothetical protein
MSDTASKAAVEKHGLHPIAEPLGDSHHTDAPFTKEDEEIAELAFWLGGLFIDKETSTGAASEMRYSESYFYKEKTSIDEWKRVARALRLHGLKIVDVERR